MPDIARTGLTGGKRIVVLAEAHNIPYSPHIGGGWILSRGATVQLAAATLNFTIMENPVEPLEWLNALLKEPLICKDGHFELPERPGLGVEIDEEKLRGYICE